MEKLDVDKLTDLIYTDDEPYLYGIVLRLCNKINEIIEHLEKETE